MLQISQIGIKGCPDIAELLPGELRDFSKQLIDLLYGLVEVIFCAVAYVASIRLDDFPPKKPPLFLQVPG